MEFCVSVFVFTSKLSANDSSLGLYVKVLHLLGKQGQWRECEEGRGPCGR